MPPGVAAAEPGVAEAAEPVEIPAVRVAIRAAVGAVGAEAVPIPTFRCSWSFSMSYNCVTFVWALRRQAS